MRGFHFLRVAIVVVVVVLTATLSISCQSQKQEKKEEPRSEAVTGTEQLKKGDFKKAITLLEKAAKKEPKNVQIQSDLGYAYEATGNLDKALKSYGASLARDPKQPELLYRVAIIHKSKGETSKAIDGLEKAISLNKSFVGARLVLGDLYYENGKTKSAKEQYEAIVKLKPFGLDLAPIKKKLAKIK